MSVPRVVSVTSAAYSWMKSGTHFTDLTWTKTPYDKKLAFGRSKLANILFTRELAARTAGTSVKTYCLDPGTMATEGIRNFDHNLSLLAKIVRNILNVSFVKHFFFKTAAEGVQSIIYCCVEESIKDQSGRLILFCLFLNLMNSF